MQFLVDDNAPTDITDDLAPAPRLRILAIINDDGTVIPGSGTKLIEAEFKPLA